ncbi:hypothetical protein DNHGIG_25760 [Collibacillus ludicampi]|uniref:Uncharacterized protein n=1 Tax=Collibacillus ludicampi TaxID=2771369 RepID=A0AAV4LGS9_9BACL|nr:hypothetical protein [Collibacillus ludicampi]GIM47027.1 hypothetical protein DNHGIG_25760 [Collibacillus ludicampi]
MAKNINQMIRELQDELNVKMQAIQQMEQEIMQKQQALQAMINDYNTQNIRLNTLKEVANLSASGELDFRPEETPAADTQGQEHQEEPAQTESAQPTPASQS